MTYRLYRDQVNSQHNVNLLKAVLAESESTRQQAIIAVAPLRPPKEDTPDDTGNAKAVVVLGGKKDSKNGDGLKQALKNVATDAKEALTSGNAGRPSVNDINQCERVQAGQRCIC